MLIPMVAADLVKWCAYGPCMVTKIFGYNNQATDLYIQLHQVPPLANGTLTAGAVPVAKSLLTQTKNGFMFPFPDGMHLSELLVAISTTEATYTAVGAGGGLDLTIEVDSQYLCDGTEVVTGNLTIATTSLQPWSNATGPKHLLRLTAQEVLGAARWVGITAKDVASSPIRQFHIGANAQLDLLFGKDGWSPFQQDSAFVGYDGCLIGTFDNTPWDGTFTANSLYLRSIHR